jgi:hypothetical protein
VCSRDSCAQITGGRSKKSLGFDNSFVVSSTHRSDDLEIFWNNDINVSLLPYSQYHIDAIITKGNSPPWRLTCVYGKLRRVRDTRLGICINT